jgi:Skp family chaperone for outer membrane proteins
MYTCEQCVTNPYTCSQRVTKEIQDMKRELETKTKDLDDRERELNEATATGMPL